VEREIWSSEERFGAEKRVLKLEGEREIWSSEESFEVGSLKDIFGS
jgi:hypothetical protein